MPEGQRRWAAMAALLLGLLLVVMDQTITAVLLPSIIDDLDTTVGVASLTITVFTVVAAVFLIPVGRIVDRVGRRRAAVAAMIIFAAGSAVTGAAVSVPMLLAGRAIQGFVLALYAPATIGLMNTLFPGGRARTLAFALWATVAGSAAAIGPLLGGAFAEGISWRWAFFIGPPIALAAAAALRATAPESHAQRMRSGFDVAGAVLLGIGVATIVVALQEGSTLGWLTAPDSNTVSATPFLLGAGVVALAALVVLERRRARTAGSALLDPRVLGVPSFRLALTASALMSMAVYAIVLLVSIYLQFVLLTGPLVAGLVLACLGAGSAIGGVGASRLINRFGAGRIAVAGLVPQPLVLAGLMPLVHDPGDPWTIAPLLALYGFSYGSAFSALTNLTFADVPKDVSSLAGGIASTSRLAAASLATALMVTTSTVLATSGLDAELERYDLTPAQRDTVEQAAHFSTGAGTSDGGRDDTLSALGDDPQLAPLVTDVEDRLIDATRGVLVLGIVLVAASGGVALRLAHRLRAPPPLTGGVTD